MCSKSQPKIISLPFVQLRRCIIIVDNFVYRKYGATAIKLSNLHNIKKKTLIMYILLNVNINYNLFIYAIKLWSIIYKVYKHVIHRILEMRYKLIMRYVLGFQSPTSRLVHVSACVILFRWKCVGGIIHSWCYPNALHYKNFSSVFCLLIKAQQIVCKSSLCEAVCAPGHFIQCAPFIY